MLGTNKEDTLISQQAIAARLKELVRVLNSEIDSAYALGLTVDIHFDYFSELGKEHHDQPVLAITVNRPL